MTARTKKFATVSTTSLIRQVGERAEWNVSKAVSILRSWSYDHPNAKSAIAIITCKADGATNFAIDEKHFGTIVSVAA